MNMLTSDDMTLLLATIIELTVLGWLISRLITFLPSFMVSIIKKVKNKSIIYSDSYIDKPDVQSNIDQSDMGTKTLIDRWFKL